MFIGSAFREKLRQFWKIGVEGRSIKLTEKPDFIFIKSGFRVAYLRMVFWVVFWIITAAFTYTEVLCDRYSKNLDGSCRGMYDDFIDDIWFNTSLKNQWDDWNGLGKDAMLARGEGFEDFAKNMWERHRANVYTTRSIAAIYVLILIVPFFLPIPNAVVIDRSQNAIYTHRRGKLHAAQLDQAMAEAIHWTYLGVYQRISINQALVVKLYDDKGKIHRQHLGIFPIFGSVQSYQIQDWLNRWIETGLTQDLERRLAYSPNLYQSFMHALFTWSPFRPRKQKLYL